MQTSYKILKLSDVNPVLAQELRKKCFSVVGLCQQVHHDMGPFLNEYMYQDALQILLEENHIDFVKEFYFSVMYHGKQIRHKHYVDFFINNDIYVECKALDQLGTDQRQQLWNYMRLTNVNIGILYNFAPIQDQCERYFLDRDQNVMFFF